MLKVGCVEACDAPCVAEFDDDVNRLALGASTEEPLPAGLRLLRAEFEVADTAGLSCDDCAEDGIVNAGWVVVDTFWRLANGLGGVDAGVVENFWGLANELLAGVDAGAFAVVVALVGPKAAVPKTLVDVAGAALFAGVELNRNEPGAGVLDVVSSVFCALKPLNNVCFDEGASVVDGVFWELVAKPPKA